jgi:hypothetical protein
MDTADQWGGVDEQDVVIVRAARDAAVAEGFGSAELEAAVDEALAQREAAYDFVVLLNTADLPSVFPGAQAFNRSYNSGVRGIGKPLWSDPDRPLLAALWMNAWEDWDRFGPDRTAWIFAQEIGHQWLAEATFDDGADRSSDLLLGRSDNHWSYFTNTANSPMEGNAWIDNGDGTFTTDVDAEPAFCPLDLYIMGFLPAEEVPPTFVIADPVGPRTASSGPEHVSPTFGPITVSGVRVDVTIDQIVGSLGPRSPTAAQSQRDFAVLPVLVLGPDEILTRATLDGVVARMAEFEAAWARFAGAHSTMTFGVTDEGRGLPPLEPTPALVPRGAW